MKSPPLLPGRNAETWCPLAFAGAFSIWAPNFAQADTTGMFGLARNGPAGWMSSRTDNV